MRKIEGNTPFVIQTKSTKKDESGKIVKNQIGEPIIEWVPGFSFSGVLGLQTGDSRRTNFNAKIEESSHVLVCDYHAGIYALADQDTRVIAKNKMYDVLLIDNPDELDMQLEIYLRFVGGQNGRL